MIHLMKPTLHNLQRARVPVTGFIDFTWPFFMCKILTFELTIIYLAKWCFCERWKFWKLKKWYFMKNIVSTFNVGSDESSSSTSTFVSIIWPLIQLFSTYSITKLVLLSTYRYLITKHIFTSDGKWILWILILWLRHACLMLPPKATNASKW